MLLHKHHFSVSEHKLCWFNILKCYFRNIMRRMSDRLDPNRVGDTQFTGSNSQVGRAGHYEEEGYRIESFKRKIFNWTIYLSELFWSKGVGNRLTTSIICEQNHKLFRSILWSSFRNPKSVQNIMREKSPSSSAPCHFVASTLRSISRESLRNLGQCRNSSRLATAKISGNCS